ncbi:MAG: FG-GAP-like repeat-containing protein [Terracidiphilus sp.]
MPTATTLAITSGGSAVTTVTSGSVVTLTATVLAGTTPVTVGQVNFCDASAAHCTDIHIVGTAQLTSAGTATFKFRPGVGSHSYNAVFLGTPNGATAYAGSTSSAAALSVTGLSPSITTLAVSPGTSSNTYDFRATVGGNGSTAPTGTVSFLNTSNSNAVLGTGTLGAGTAGVSLLNASNSAGLSGAFAVGDFNEDGIPDLAAIDGISLTILLGNGDGIFTTTTRVAGTGYSPESMAVGDFNGDGNLDLAVANYCGNDTTCASPGTVTILLGNGNGEFPAGVPSPETGYEPESIAVGDFNGDGIPDLAVANECGNDRTNCVSGTVTILLGNGDGTFTPKAVSPSTGPIPTSIAVGDFNGDGNLDLAVAITGGDSVMILLGDGKGNFTPATTSLTEGTAPISVAVGDFNGDGILDLAVACEYPNPVTNPATTPGVVVVLLGNGDGTFTPTATSPATGLRPESIVTADFNGDGIPDLAVANLNSDSVTVLLGDGTGNFTSTAVSPYATDPAFVAAGDFNGDGISDLAVSTGNYANGTILEAATQTATAAVNGIAAPFPPGTETVEASYAGGSNYSASTSGATVLNPLLIIPTVNVAPSSSSIAAGQDLTVTVTVSGPSIDPTPTGSVTLTSGSYGSGATTLSGGIAQINIPAGSLATGTDTLTVNYVPDASSSALYTIASGGSTVAVGVATPTVTVTPALTNILPGQQALQVSVSVSGPPGYPTPTGSVVLTNGNTSTATPLSSGAAQINIPTGDLAVGGDLLTVTYTPDASSFTVYSSASGVSAVNVYSSTLWTPDVTVMPSSSSITTAQALGVSISLSYPQFSSLPTGSVTLNSGSYNPGAVAVGSYGEAQINIPAGSLPVGNDTLIFTYTPDASSSEEYTSAVGATSVAVIPLFTPAVTVTPSSSSILSIQALGVNISVSGHSGEPTPTGSVALTSGSYKSGSITFSGGGAQINIPAGSLATGNNTLTVNYTPDASSSIFYTSASGASTVAVALATPTVTVTPDSLSITPFQTLTVTVSLSGPAGGPVPTGAVKLTSGSYTSVGATLSSGTASITIPAGALSLGSDTLTVNYTPDSTSSTLYAGATGSSSVTVSTVTPTVLVSPASRSLLASQVLSVTVAVSGPSGGPTATGSVTLTSGSYDSGAVTLSGGSATINIPANSLSTGTDTLTAIYTPDSGSPGYASASGASTVVVNPRITPAVTVTPSASSILTTQALGVNISVSGPSGNPNPTGSVDLTSGGYNSGAVTLAGGSATINIPANSLSTGNDTLTAIYTSDSGSPGYTSASGTSTVAVSSFTPTVTVTPLATSILTTQALQVNASVSGPSGDPAPTGSVDLTSGSYDSGAVTLSSGSVAINIPAGSLGAGTDTLSVSYTPDSASSATYSSTTGSSSVTVTAPNGSPTVGSMSPAFQTAGNDAFTLTVNGAGFFSGSTVYWGTTALTTQFVSTAQITAQVPASDIADSGTDSITVESPMPGGGTSNTLQFEVDSSGSGSPSLATNTATVTPGQSATYAVTLPSAPSAVTASCLNLPTGASCSYSSSTNTMTIATSTTTPAGTYQVTMVFTETVAGAASAFIFLPILVLPLVRARRKWTAGKIWFTACLGLVLLVASAGIGCGGGGTSSTQPPPSTHQITTSAVVTLTVQ